MAKNATTKTTKAAAATKAARPIDVSNVQILKVGHAYIEGERGAAGGAASKDSIWGVATISGAVVKFFGRRGGKLRFKTERRDQLEAALAMFQDKCAGKGGKDYSYTELNGREIEKQCPGLAAAVKTGFNAAKKDGKVNNRATKPVAKAA